MTASATSPFAIELGTRLRATRHLRGLFLKDVEEQSEGHWKAVVVGSYERGDRAISAKRLMELADFYGVAAAELIQSPHSQDPTILAAGALLTAMAMLREVRPDLAAALRPLLEFTGADDDHADDSGAS